MKDISESMSTLIKTDVFERLLIISIAAVVLLLFLHFLKRAISKKVTDTDKKYRARKATNIIGYLLLISIVLFVYSDKLGNIGIALGLAGAGIAFALQEVITSIAGWFSIMITNQVKVGQRVRIGEITGDIIDIDVLKTTIMEVGDWINGDLYNGRITSVSNSFVFKVPIQNYSADYPFLWDELNVPIRTESDFELAREVITKVTKEICGKYAAESKENWIHMKDKYRIEDAQVDPLITLTFDENWITFTVRYVVDYTKRRSTKNLLFTRLLQEIKNYPDIIMIAASTLEVTNISASEKE